MDKLTAEKRSENMAAIKSRDTKPELLIRRWLFARGYRYRLCVKYIPGHPDLYLKKYNTAIFVHGCFWHRHVDCKYAYMPKSKVSFWENKFRNNIERDKTVKRMLDNKGIKCLIVWECTIRKMSRDDNVRDEVLERIDCFLHNLNIYCEI